MDNISELKRILGQGLAWHKSRVDCFSKMLLALFTVSTVNLKKMALAMAGKAQANSHYRRLQRFFSQFEMSFDQVARWIFALFFSSTDKIYLCLDRTNWFWGKSPINILMLSIAYEGIAIPILWCVLPKDGTSNTDERINLMSRFVALFGTTCIAGLLADREFIGKRWFAWLNQKRIAFYIRIKDNTQLKFNRRTWQTAKQLFHQLKPREQYCLPMSVYLMGQKCFITGAKSHTGELMVIASNQPHKEAAAVYLRRWEIECLFKSLKSHGFQFEDTHLTHPQRIEKLLVLLAIGFCWAHKIGEWKAQSQPIKMRQYQDKSKRPVLTFFRYGLNTIQQTLFNLQTKLNEFQLEFKRFLDLIRPAFEQVRGAL